MLPQVSRDHVNIVRVWFLLQIMVLLTKEAIELFFEAISKTAVEKYVSGED